jgi:hypothetical protein
MEMLLRRADAQLTDAEIWHTAWLMTAFFGGAAEARRAALNHAGLAAHRRRLAGNHVGPAQAHPALAHRSVCRSWSARSFRIKVWCGAMGDSSHPVRAHGFVRPAML